MSFIIYNNMKHNRIIKNTLFFMIINKLKIKEKKV